MHPCCCSHIQTCCRDGAPNGAPLSLPVDPYLQGWSPERMERRSPYLLIPTSCRDGAPNGAPLSLPVDPYYLQGWSPERSAALGAGMLGAVLEVLPRLR